MPLDSLSYTSISRIRALVVPIGRIKRSRFLQFFEQLSHHNVVRLGDVTPDRRPDRTAFSPQGFPQGEIIYDFILNSDREHEYLESFQLYRRKFMVIGIADAAENNDWRQLQHDLEELKEMYPRAVYYPGLIFESPRDSTIPEEFQGANFKYAPNFLSVPPKEEVRLSEMRTIVGELTTVVLSEFTILAKSIQAMGNIDSPMSAGRFSAAAALQNRMSQPAGGSPFPATSNNDRRMSAQTTGTTSASERHQSRGKGRIQISVAELYLLAGRIPDALNEFVEGATAAKAQKDNLWHGKALESIGVCLILLARYRYDYQIPKIPYPDPDLPEKKKEDFGVVKLSASDPQLLIELLPELTNSALILYARAASFTGETLPVVCQSESILRMSKLLVALYFAHGLNGDMLDHIVLGTKLHKRVSAPVSNMKLPTKLEIGSFTMRAYPAFLDALSVADSSRILGGVATIMGAIDFKRRKALVTRDLVRVLIPGLIQARVMGAAEAGVHPAAGLSASVASGSSGGSPLELTEPDLEVGIVEMLEDLCASFGIITPTKAGTKHEAQTLSPTEEVLADSELRLFGWPSLKIDVLRFCIQLCEALPDFKGALRFSTRLLRAAGTELTKEEQMRLSSNISRTMLAGRKLGLRDIEGDYWDPFLLRNVEFTQSAIYKAPVPHSEEDLQKTEANAEPGKDTNPFIYSSFNKQTNQPAAEIFVSEGEPAEFAVTLQNPFEFEIDIESLMLDAEGPEMECKPVTTVIPPARSCRVSVVATFKSSGKLKINGCRIHVFGCKERLFPIFTEGFDEGQLQLKPKFIGLSAIEPRPKRPVSTVVTNPKRQSRAAAAPEKPVPRSLELSVVPKQPLVFATSTSLSQSALMVLEGEKRLFSVKLHNSSDVPVDLVHFSFEDSTTAQLEQALAMKEISSSEIYEYEVFLIKRRAFEWHRPDEDKDEDGENKVLIPPHTTSSFQIKVLGKPGLTSGVVQVDYGYRHSKDSGRIYTRQVSIPLTVTVNASVELSRVDFLPLSSTIPLSASTSSPDDAPPATTGMSEYASLFSHLATNQNTSQYCLMLLDLRNAWPQPLKVTLGVRDAPDTPITYTTSATLQPGHTSRLLLPVKRILLPPPYPEIPTLSAKPRQFVVSTNTLSPTQESATREAFWFRERVLSIISAEWEELGTGRTGDVELRGIRLGGKALDALRIDGISVDMEVTPAALDDDGEGEEEDKGFRKVSNDTYRLALERFYNLRVRIVNHTQSPATLLFRILPLLKNQPPAVALDLSRKLVFNGVLQRGAGRLKPGEERVVELGFVAFCGGEYEVLVMAEEANQGDGWSEGGKRTGRGSVNITVG
ncbi:Trs120-domain-containing protein [Ascobolus immersus RN42]|uniref:Trs120-domain-containing protein n=1 Tax=Ascobolus immersus RN42 TaxID=1160509 RepID=A0A3N4IMB2_ASCIM|nr:Trs120-domain-containing protein [Ascobolus immersus RN42]